jgi:mRNA-degrading endonuclease toxin of MazEF toxin-antitoxin module
MAMKQFDFYIIDLDRTKGAELKKTHPAVIIFPDAMNKIFRL